MSGRTQPWPVCEAADGHRGQKATSVHSPKPRSLGRERAATHHAAEQVFAGRRGRRGKIKDGDRFPLNVAMLEPRAP